MTAPGSIPDTSAPVSGISAPTNPYAAPGVLGVPQAALDAASAPLTSPAPGAPMLPPLAQAAISGVKDAGSTLAGALGYEAPAVPKLTEMLAQHPPTQPMLPPNVVSGDEGDAIGDVRQGLKLAELAKRDPDLYTAINAQRDEAATARAATAQKDDATRELARASADHDAYLKSMATSQQATQQLMTDATALGNAKVDPDRWWGSRSTGQKIGAYVAAIAGGLNSPNTGGRNMGLDQINKEIDNDIDAQKATLSNRHAALGLRQSAIGQMVAQSGDLYRAQETFRVAAHEQVIRQLQAEQAQYDPRGTTAQHIGQAIVQQRAIQQKAINDFQAQSLKSQLEVSKFALDQQDKLAGQKAKNRELDLSAWKTSVDQQQHQLEHQDREADIAQREKDRAIARETAADAKAEKKEGLTIGNGFDGNLKNGTDANAPDYYAPDEATAAKIRPMIAGANEVNRLTNQLAREIKDWGGQSDTIQGPKWQKIQSDKEALIFALHATSGIEGFRPGTAEMLDKLAGNVDPTSFLKTATPGILEARDNVNSSINATLGTMPGGFKGRYEPPDTSTIAPPRLDELDELGQTLNGNGKVAPKNAAEVSAQANEGMGTSPIQGAYNASKYLSDRIAGKASTIPDSQMDAFHGLQLALTAGNAKQQQKATQILSTLVDKAPTVELQNYAAWMLQNNAVSRTPLPADGDDEPVRQSAPIEAPLYDMTPKKKAKP